MGIAGRDLYPAGGGVGMIGMWKAFEELEALGWIDARRPKMIAVQAEGCQPIVRAFEKEPRQHILGQCLTRGQRASRSEAAGRCPDARRRAAKRRHRHRRVDEELIDAGIRLAEEEGIFAAPEGAACVAAAQRFSPKASLSTKTGSSSTTPVQD